MADRFWAKVNKGGPIMPGMKTCCWLWMGDTNGKGYGSLTTGGRGRRLRVAAHRLSWMLRHTTLLPSTTVVMHRCDNSMCVRHLFTGTQQDNVADMVKKGRQQQGKQHWLRRRRCAGREHIAKMNEARLANLGYRVTKSHIQTEEE
jgi:hypothetical protein